MSETSYKTEVIVTIYTGFLLCPLGDLYKGMEGLCGFPVWTHQVPRVMEQLQPELAKCLPWLESITVPEDRIKDESFRSGWITGLQTKYGDAHELPQLLSDMDQRDPIAEAVEMVGADRVVVVGGGG